MNSFVVVLQGSAATDLDLASLSGTFEACFDPMDGWPEDVVLVQFVPTDQPVLPREEVVRRLHERLVAECPKIATWDASAFQELDPFCARLDGDGNEEFIETCQLGQDPSASQEDWLAHLTACARDLGALLTSGG